MEKIYLLKIYVTGRGKLAKTIFTLKKITAENGILRQERGGISNVPHKPGPLSSLPRVTFTQAAMWRVDGARLWPNPLAKNSEPHFRIKY